MNYPTYQGYMQPQYNQFQQGFQPQYQQNYQFPIQQPMTQQTQPIKNLQGKIVDSIDVVKATEVPLDGTVSYFPLADNTAIITKQLQIDGTSKINIYKISDANITKNESNNHITIDELNKRINELEQNSIKSIKEDTNEVKKQLDELLDALLDRKKGK